MPLDFDGAGQPKTAFLSWLIFPGPYLEGQGDFVSRLNGVTIWVKGVINLRTKSP